MASKVVRKLKSAGKHLLMAWYAFRHPATPLPGKLVLLLMMIYLFSPIDLVPDTFPVLGWLDDLALISFGLPALFRLLPSEVLMHSQEMADNFILRVFRLYKH